LLVDPWSGCSSGWSARFWLREKKAGLVGVIGRLRNSETEEVAVTMVE
jgi:hypothetical protein